VNSQISVEIRNLTKTIGKKTIVDNLSLDVPRGEVFGLLGPNGAGKTTTIRMMVGLIAKNNGKVFINGIDVEKNFSQAMNHVGAIVENPEFYRFLTGYQNLKHFANMSVGVTKERIDEVVELVALGQRIHDKVKTYSLGMRQRLGLAQSLLRKPDVLILDEPTNGLDPAGIRELRDHLRSLAKNAGVAVIVSSHLLTEMELICDRVAIIQSGKLVDVRPIRDMVSADALQVIEIELDAATSTGTPPSDAPMGPDALHAPDTENEARVVLATEYPDFKVLQNGNKLQVSLPRDAIPALIKSLAVAGVKIYGVQRVNQSLEDRFLEMTGGVSHVD